jgi:hypothetical protein
LENQADSQENYVDEMVFADDNINRKFVEALELFKVMELDIN